MTGTSFSSSIPVSGSTSFLRPGPGEGDEDALLALADIAAEFLRLAVGHPGRFVVAALGGRGPEENDIGAAVGFAVVAERKGRGRLLRLDAGLPRPLPWPHAFFELRQDRVGDFPVDVSRHRLLLSGPAAQRGSRRRKLLRSSGDGNTMHNGAPGQARCGCGACGVSGNRQTRAFRTDYIFIGRDRHSFSAFARHSSAMRCARPSSDFDSNLATVSRNSTACSRSAPASREAARFAHTCA